MRGGKDISNKLIWNQSIIHSLINFLKYISISIHNKFLFKQNEEELVFYFKIKGDDYFRVTIREEYTKKPKKFMFLNLLCE